MEHVQQLQAALQRERQQQQHLLREQQALASMALYQNDALQVLQQAVAAGMPSGGGLTWRQHLPQQGASTFLLPSGAAPATAGPPPKTAAPAAATPPPHHATTNAGHVGSAWWQEIRRLLGAVVGSSSSSSSSSLVCGVAPGLFEEFALFAQSKIGSMAPQGGAPAPEPPAHTRAAQQSR